MWLLSENYFQAVLQARTCLFFGSVGSYKTLSAVATAHTLLKSKKFERVYDNFPVTFASSPPLSINNFDFLDARYASNSIFIIDESALFLSGKHDEVAQVFAFPRKLNQVFLLASVLPTRQVESYCNLFVRRYFNFSLIGIPLLQFLSAPTLRATRKDKISHFIFGYSYYFPKFNSKFRPDRLYPIRQYRDTGTLYDELSREVPEKISKFFYVDNWGQAKKKNNLSTNELWQIEQILPEFEPIALNENNDYPKLQQKFNFNAIGTEFNFKFFIQIIILIYFSFIMIKFVSNALPNDPVLQKWTSKEYICFFTGKRVKCYEDNAITTQQKQPAVKKPKIIETVEYTIEK